MTAPDACLPPRSAPARGDGAETAGPEPEPRFRSTLARVLLVQAATLLLLWLLQSSYRG